MLGIWVIFAPLMVFLIWLIAGFPQTLGQAWSVRTLVQLGVIIPICEEVVFRGLIQHELASYQRFRTDVLLGLSGANLISSVLYAFLYTVFLSTPLAFSMVIPALIYGHIYHRKRSLIYPIILHAWYNVNGILIYSLWYPD